MEYKPDNHKPPEDSFHIPKLDLSIGDQADLYLKVRQYDRIKYGFCDKYGYKLGEAALCLARCGGQEYCVCDGIKTTNEIRQRYEEALKVALEKVIPDDQERWMTEFLANLNHVHSMALEMNMH